MDNFTIITNAYKSLKANRIVGTQREFAKLLDVNESTISKALKGEPNYLTDKLVSRVNAILEERNEPLLFDIEKQSPDIADPGLPILPTSAIAGTLGDFADSVMTYDCERIVSPINGVDFAMKVCGESMSPEYPNGSTILIKRVNERAFIEWGKVYVLDTDNGAIVKQIRKTDDKSVVECISLNPEFQSFTIDTTFIKGWYRVLMVLSSK